MVDLSKISKAVQNFVENTKAMDGKKKSIDTPAEYQKLGDYLAGNKDNLNVHEKEFIQGFMLEYESNETKKKAEAEKQQFEDSVTESTKEAVKRIAKSMGDKKTIDTDAEATALATMLKNSKGDLNNADLQYVRNILSESGYGNYLEDDKNAGVGGAVDVQPKEDTPKGEVVATPQKTEGSEQQKTVEENKEDRASSTDTSQNKEPMPIRKKPPVSTGKLPNDNTPKNGGRGQGISDKTTPSKTSKNTAKSAITEAGRNSGNSLANIVINEVESHYADNNKIHSALKRVNSQNAFTFVGRIVTQTRNGVNKTVFSVSDVFNKITYKDTLHVMKSLLQQAGNMGLQKTNAYQNMVKEIEYVNRRVAGEPGVDPSKGERANSDRAIAMLYNEMAKKIQ